MRSGLHRNRRSLFVTVLVLLLTVGTSAVHAGVTAQEVLAACDQSLRAARTWSMQVSTEATAVASPAFQRVIGGTFEDRGTYVRDRDRVDVDMTLTAAPIRAGASRVGKRERAVVNGYMVVYSKSPEGRTEGLWFAQDGKKFMSLALSPMAFERALEGWLFDPEPVTAILRECADLRITDQAEPLDSHACVVVTGTSKYGKYTLWCDPQLGYLPRRVSLTKTGSDVTGRTTFDKLQLASPSGNGFEAPQRMQVTADSMTFQTIEGVTLPLSCRTVTRYEFADGNWHERRVLVKREKIDLHPDLNKPDLFQPDLPDGTILSNQEDLNGPYEWRDGKPVPSTRKRLAAAATPPTEPDATSLIGKAAPAFSLPTLDGGKVNLSDQKGKVMVLDFWATWCPPCRKSLPHVQQLTTDPERLKKGLVVWLIDDKEDDATVKKFLKENGYNFTIPMDYVGEVLAKYLVHAIPTTVIIGRDGMIQKVFIGYGPDTGKAIDDAVDAALKSEPSL
jgi:peroxiredoxin